MSQRGILPTQWHPHPAPRAHKYKLLSSYPHAHAQAIKKQQPCDAPHNSMMMKRTSMSSSSNTNTITSGSSKRTRMTTGGSSLSSIGGDANNNIDDDDDILVARPPPPGPMMNTPIPKSPFSTTASSTTNTAPPHSSTITPEDQHRQDRRVCYLRLLMIITLLTATAIVAYFAGSYVVSDERSNFELQYRDSVAQVAAAFQHRIDAKHDTAKTISAMITSRYGNSNNNNNKNNGVVAMTSWNPNVTIPDFQEQTAASLHIADGRALSFNPIITHNVNRLEWEAHAAENSAWILGSDDHSANNLNNDNDDLQASSWPNNRTVSFGIYSRDPTNTSNIIYDPGSNPSTKKYPNVLVPVWQIAPIKSNEKAVMFNLHSESHRRQALDHMMEYGVPALTAMLQLVQDGGEIRPSSILFYPVFDMFGSSASFSTANAAAAMKKDATTTNDMTEEKEEDVVVVVQEQNKQPTVVGSISIVFSWDTLLQKIMPDYIKGVICVLRSSTGQTYTFSLSGDTVTLLGEGDLHDTNYDKYGKHVKANLGNKHQNQQQQGTITDADTTTTNPTTTQEDYLITYELHVYPSSELESQYVTNRAGIFAAGIILIFLFTAGLFLLYDYLVENRQQKTARLARQTGNIVDSMFPAAFRERLYSIHGNHHHDHGSVNDAAAAVVAGGGVASGGGVRNRRSSMRSSIRSNKSSSVGGDTNSSVGAGASNNSDTVARAASTVAMGNTTAPEDAEKASTTPNSSTARSPVLSLPRQLSTMGSASMGGKRALKQIDKFMKGSSSLLTGAATASSSSDQNNPLAPPPPSLGGTNGFLDNEPIADLFHDTSIMFSDIVGFTKWSSERSPNEVFRLLEQIFWEFDDLAVRHNVFKLGTIGDCYIAVTGIPDPVADHAIVLTQFAFDARDKVREVCGRLEREGLDTAKLDMRFGIHSGSTTAGILRGTKSRFELFGDTINTASRMESTGLEGKIQVSEETAELIRRDGKPRWLIKRDTMITAKGKGELQTYWVEPQRASYRVSFSDRVSNFFMENNHLIVSKGSLDDCCNSSAGGQLSQCDEEEKLEEDLEEDDLEVGVLSAAEDRCKEEEEEDNLPVSKVSLGDCCCNSSAGGRLPQ